jgi:putative membrane protein
MQWWCAALGAPWVWRWRPYPGVWLFIALLGLAYWRLAGRGATRGQRLCFGAGLLVLWSALDWPLGALGGGYLASVHMVQFLLIALISPPLLLSGIPVSALERLVGRTVLFRIVGLLTHPLRSILLFGLVLVVTHWPAVVDTLMASQAGSFLLDMAWLGAGICFWWPVIVPVPVRPRFSYPVKVAYLILATVVMTAPYIFLTFAGLPFYATYELAPPVGNLSARTDQRIAGLIMRIGGGAVLWIAAGIFFYRWNRAENPPVHGVSG